MEDDRRKKFTAGENARQNGKKGGVKSGESRRLKRDVADIVEHLLAGEAKSRKAKSLLKRMYGEEEDDDYKSYLSAMIAGQIESAIKGNTKAFVAVIDTFEKKDRGGPEEKLAEVVSTMREAFEDED